MYCCADPKLQEVCTWNVSERYQKFESFRSCDTFIPAVYRKSTKHARWDQISKTKWRIHQGDVSG